MVNGIRRNVCSFRGMKCKILQHDGQHYHGCIQLHSKRMVFYNVLEVYLSVIYSQGALICEKKVDK